MIKAKLGIKEWNDECQCHIDNGIEKTGTNYSEGLT